MGRRWLRDSLLRFKVRRSSASFTRRGFFLAVAEGLELLFDGLALRKQELDGLLPEFFGFFYYAHKCNFVFRDTAKRKGLRLSFIFSVHLAA
jgi:hypothetical protein